MRTSTCLSFLLLHVADAKAVPNSPPAVIAGEGIKALASSSATGTPKSTAVAWANIEAAQNKLKLLIERIQTKAQLNTELLETIGTALSDTPGSAEELGQIELALLKVETQLAGDFPNELIAIQIIRDHVEEEKEAEMKAEAENGIGVPKEGASSAKVSSRTTLAAKLDRLNTQLKEAAGSAKDGAKGKSRTALDAKLDRLNTELKAFTPVGHGKEDFKGANFMGKGFTYLPEDKRKDLYGYNPKKDAELGADDNVLGNVPFLMAYGGKTTNKEYAPYHGTFPAYFNSY